MTALLGCSAENVDVAELVRARRQAARQGIHARLQRALEEGDLHDRTDIDALSSLYAAIMQGMAVQARDGASEAMLQGVASAAMAAWPVNEPPLCSK